MVKESINESLPKVSYDPLISDVERQKLIECVLSGNVKHYLRKAYTREQVNKLSAEEVNKLFSNYEAKLLCRIVKALGKSIIKMHSTGTCAIVGMTSQDALSNDLESDPFLNSALQKFICEKCYRFGSLLAPLSVGLIMSRHYLSEPAIENGGTNADDRSDEPTVGNSK